MLDVYKSCYRLKDEPFRLSPDHRYSYVHPSYANAKAYLKYAISQGEGFIAITGEPGTGKTTLINGLLEELDKTRIQVATLRNIHLDPGNLIKMVADAFNLHLNGDTKTGNLQELERFLKRQIQKGLRAVLIVDEAQGLSTPSLEELRLLSNLQNDNRLLLQVFLVGQEEVMDLIHAPAMEHLQQRLIAASHLERLDLEETVAYIEHRLCHAGWRGDPAVNEQALRLIHTTSCGVPRRINLICNRLFLYGGLEQKHELVGDDALHIIGELQKERVLSSDQLQDIADAVSTSGPCDTSALSLPRAESSLLFEQCEEQAIQERSSKPPAVAEEQTTATPPTGDERDQSVAAFAVKKPREGAVAVKQGWRWALAAALVLLIGSAFVVSMGADIRAYLAALMPEVSDPIGPDSVSPPVSVPEQGAMANGEIHRDAAVQDRQTTADVKLKE